MRRTNEALIRDDYSVTQAEQAGEGSELLDAEAACRVLGVHRNTLYRLIASGDIPALRLTRGGRWRFPKAQLRDWIEARQTRRER